MKKFLLILCSLIFITGCTETVPKIKSTQSGKPEVTIRAEPRMIQNKILNSMASQSISIVSQTNNSLVLALPGDNYDKGVAVVSLGKGQVYRVLTFNFFQSANGTRVVMQAATVVDRERGGSRSQAIEDRTRVFNYYQQYLQNLAMSF